MTVPLAAILLLLTLPPPEAGSAAGDVVENQRLRLRLHPPRGWRVVKDGSLSDEMELEQGGGEGPRIVINVYPFELDDPSDLSKTQRELSAILLRRFPNLRVVQEKQLSHGEHPAIQVVATLPLQDDFYHVLQRCIFAGRRVYVVTCASFEGSFVSDLPTYYAFLDRVEILGPGTAASRDPSAVQHLASPGLAGLVGLAFIPVGLLLRRLSVSRLKRLGRWPLPPPES